MLREAKKNLNGERTAVNRPLQRVLSTGDPRPQRGTTI